MFEFKILQCPDRSQNGTYEHMGDELVIGSSEGEMIIDDPQLGPSQLKLYFEGGSPYVENLFPDCQVKLNQNIIPPGRHSLKARDSIHMGKTIINFIKIKPGPLEPQKITDEDKTKGIEAFKEGSPERAIYTALDFLSKKSATLTQEPDPNVHATELVPGESKAPPLPKIPPGIPPLPTKK